MRALAPGAVALAALAAAGAGPAQAHDAHAAWLAAPSLAASAGLPDVEQIPPYKIGVVRRDGRWHLGFASAARNVGAGGLRIRGSRRPDGSMAAQQLSEDGLQVLAPAVGTLRYVTTYGHAHWHYMRFMRYELRGIDVPGALMDRKQGFCLGDAPWVVGWCSRGQPEASAIEEGIRAGGIDIYEPNVEGQEIEIDRHTAPTGRYVLTSRIGPTGVLAETRSDNNVASTVIQLRWPLADGQAPALLGSCVGEECAGRVPPAPRLPRMSARDAQRLARRALRRELGPLRSQPRIRCRAPRRRRSVCAVRLARGNVRFAGAVGVAYRQEGAAARWYYSVDVVRRLTGCQGGDCERAVRRPTRLGGEIPR
jgi:Lysyl oxidase